MHAYCHLSVDVQHVTITDRVVTIYVSLMADFVEEVGQ